MVEFMIQRLSQKDHAANIHDDLVKFRDVFFEHGRGARRLRCRDTLLKDPGWIKLIIDLYSKIGPNREIVKMKYPRPRNRAVEAWQLSWGPYCFVVQRAQWASKRVVDRQMTFSVDDIRVEMLVMRYEWPQLDLCRIHFDPCDFGELSVGLSRPVEGVQAVKQTK